MTAMDRTAGCFEVMAEYQCLAEVELVVPANQA